MTQPSQRSWTDDASVPDAATMGRPAVASAASDLATPSMVDGPTRSHTVPVVATQIGKGQLMAGRYEVLSRLGVGGMGEVWKARDTQLDRVVAIKRIRPELAGDKSLLDRFFQEAKAVAALNHPHIVQIYDRGSDGTGEFFVMEFVDGPSLSRVLAEQGAFDIERTVRIGKAICDALQAAHDKGILHRDVKPGNILLGEGDVPKLTDFGLARLESAGEHSMTAGVGTPLYMSPEQQDSVGPLNSASDQWSLAATLYHLVTGQSPRLIRENRIPDMLRPVLVRALEESPSARYPSLAALGDMLVGVIVTPTAMLKKVASENMADTVTRQRQRVARAHEQARKLASEQHAFRDACEILREIPEHVRDKDLFATLSSTADRVDTLDQQILESVDAMHWTGLNLVVDELLSLQPNRDDLRRLRISLPQDAVLEREYTNSIGMKFVLIPAGEFLMGAPPNEAEASDDEKPQHRVRITRPFYMSVFPVTQGEYQQVMGSNPSWFCATGGGASKVNTYQPSGLSKFFGAKPQIGIPDHERSRLPVEQVSWDDVNEFCRRLAALPAERPHGRHYDLPTEAQWEYACRAGTTTPFSFGNVLNGEQANVDGNHPYGTSVKGPYLERTSVVGSYPPNAWGLYDMHGNVWEWCRDWLEADAYKQSPIDDPTGAATGQHRVVRGGSWDFYCRNARSAFRGGSTLDRYDGIGGRVVSPALRQDL